MMFWIILGILSVIAILTLIMPLWRANQTPVEWQSEALAVYADQLDEVQSEAQRGLIPANDAQAAIVEIKRRMLAANRDEKSAGKPAPQGGRGVLVVAALATPMLATALYFTIGSPGTPSIPFAERQEERASAAEVTELTTRLLNRLTTDPDGGATEGWDLLAQAYMRMGQYEDAANAFGAIADRSDVTSSTLSQYAEALIASENGIVTPKASRIIDRAHDLNPDNPAAVYYKAVALDQSGDGATAYDLLVARLNSADSFAPWMEVFVGQANTIGEKSGRPRVDLASFAPMMQQDAPGPSAADMAAASDLSEEDRSAFIRSMVARLASRLETEPDDLDGWMRLGRAYGVLGENDNARAAYLRASDLAKNLDSNDPRLPAIAAGITRSEEG